MAPRAVESGRLRNRSSAVTGNVSDWDETARFGNVASGACDRKRWRASSKTSNSHADVRKIAMLVGIALGKQLFHLHGQDRRAKAVFRKKMNRRQLIEAFAAFHACTVGMVRAMLTRRHPHVVACALANKLAGAAWALATHNTRSMRA